MPRRLRLWDIRTIGGLIGLAVLIGWVLLDRLVDEFPRSPLSPETWPQGESRGDSGQDAPGGAGDPELGAAPDRGRRRTRRTRAADDANAPGEFERARQAAEAWDRWMLDASWDAAPVLLTRHRWDSQSLVHGRITKVVMEAGALDRTLGDLPWTPEANRSMVPEAVAMLTASIERQEQARFDAGRTTEEALKQRRAALAGARDAANWLAVAPRRLERPEPVVEPWQLPPVVSSPHPPRQRIDEEVEVRRARAAAAYLAAVGPPQDADPPAARLQRLLAVARVGAVEWDTALLRGRAIVRPTADAGDLQLAGLLGLLEWHAGPYAAEMRRP